MPYFLGQGTNTDISLPLRRRRPGMPGQPIIGRRQAGEVPLRQIAQEQENLITPGVPIQPEPYEEPVVTPTETAEETQPEQSYTDALLASIMGKEFETMRTAGLRGTENVMETMAREGLLGTGAVRDIASEQAWGTERNIADVLRGIEEMRYGREQDALNQLLTLLFQQMGSWGG